MHEKKENLTFAGPLARRVCYSPALPRPASSAFCHRYSGALDDGTREGGEPILLGDEAARLAWSPFHLISGKCSALQQAVQCL